MVLSVNVVAALNSAENSPSSTDSTMTTTSFSLDSETSFREDQSKSEDSNSINMKNCEQQNEENSRCENMVPINKRSNNNINVKKSGYKEKTLIPRTKSQYESFHRDLSILQQDFPHARPRELMRFLCANERNANKAALSYESHIRWKSENLPPNVDILRNSGSLFFEGDGEETNIEFYFYGTDRQGRLLAYYTISVVDEKSFNMDNVLRKIAYQVEPLVRQLDQAQQSISIILDTRKFQNKSIEYEILRQTMDFFQKHYPELITVWLIVPVSFIQRCIWSFFSIFLQERQVSRIRMLPDLHSLVHYVDQESLLITHGGKATIFDNCKSE